MKNQKGFALVWIVVLILAILGGLLLWQKGSHFLNPVSKNKNVVVPMLPPDSQIDRVVLGISACSGRQVDTHFLKEINSKETNYHVVLLLSVECFDIDWNRGDPWQRYEGILKITDRRVIEKSYDVDGLDIRFIKLDGPYNKVYLDSNGKIILEKEIWEFEKNYFEDKGWEYKGDLTKLQLNQLHLDKVSCFTNDCYKFYLKEIYEFLPDLETVKLLRTEDTSNTY